MRIIKFFDGVESSTTPTIGNIKASGIIEYPDDAAYEAAEAGSPVEGNIYFNTTTDLIRYYNGTAWINLVDESSPQTLTFKTMDGDLNTFTDISLSSLKTILADANKFIVRNALGQVVSLKTVPTGEVVGTTDAQTLTFKSIDADNNNITNIDNDNIKAGAGIEVTKLSDGSVSDSEFKALDGVTSNIQTQLNGKQSTSEKGQANGYAPLDSSSKIPAAFLPNSVMELQGFFDPATTTLVDGTGNPGDVWEASVGGSRNFGSGSITFVQGDWAVYAADNKWHKSINSNEVVSVAGKKGAVNLVIDDMTDVDTTTSAPVLGQIIQYDGTKWVNVTPTFGATNLDALTDVTITTPAVGHTLRYNGTQWVNILANIDSLTDVDTTSIPPLTGQGLVFDGTNWVPGNTGGQGDINFITNYDFEVNATGYNLYKDAAQSRPVDGTGGTPSGGLSIARTTTNPLRKTASLLVSKNNSNCQGEGFSVDFTIDDMFKAKVLANEFPYKIVSGTFNAGSPSNDSDLIVYLYNITDGVLVEPSNIKLLSNSTTISDLYRSTFQTSPTGTQYRLIFHVSSTSALPWSIMIDEVKVSPSKNIFGNPAFDTKTFSPSWASVGTQPVLGNGVLSGYVSRLGDKAFIEIKLTVGSTTTFGTGPYSFGFNSVGTVDFTKTTQSSDAMHSRGGLLDASTGVVYDIATYVAPNAFGIRNLLTNSTYASHVDTAQGTPITLAVGDTITVTGLLPISGWSTSTQMSDGYEGRELVTTYLKNASQSLSISAVTKLAFQVKTEDTTGSYDTTNLGYVVPSSGRYFISVAGVNVASPTAVNAVVYLGLGINTSTVFTHRLDVVYNDNPNVQRGLSGCIALPLKAGDIVYPLVLTLTGTATLEGIGSFSVAKVSGSASISATTKKYAKYTSNSSQSIPNVTDTVINFANKVDDTTNAVTTGAAWKYIAQQEGTYQVKGQVQFGPTNFTAGNICYLSATRYNSAGSAIEGYLLDDVIVQGTITGYYVMLKGDCRFNMVAGDYIQLTVTQNTGGAKTLRNSTASNFIEIIQEK